MYKMNLKWAEERQTGSSSTINNMKYTIILLSSDSIIFHKSK
jgi:hypothetical protein